MAKWINLIITAMVLLPLASLLVQALPLCDDQIEVGGNCTFVTPAINCSLFTYEVVNLSGTVVQTNTMTQLNQSLYSFDFHLVEEPNQYVITLCDGTTREVYVENQGVNEMFIAIALSLAIIMFVLYKGSTELPEKHSVFKMFLFMSTIVMGWVGMNFARSLANDLSAPSSVVTTVDVGYWAFLFIGLFSIGYFIIIWIIHTIRLWQFKNNEEDETDADNVY